MSDDVWVDVMQKITDVKTSKYSVQDYNNYSYSQDNNSLKAGTKSTLIERLTHDVRITVKVIDERLVMNDE